MMMRLSVSLSHPRPFKAFGSASTQQKIRLVRAVHSA